MSAHKPRSGSLAYYPKVRAKNHKATFSTYPSNDAKEAKIINFFGYKAGMVHVFGRNSHEKSVSFGQEIMIPSTVIECPPMRAIGVRVYGASTSGLKALGEVTTEKPGKHLRARIKAFKKKGKKALAKHGGKGAEKAGNDGAEKYGTFEDLEKMKERASEVVLIVEAQPSLADFGKKKADITELSIGGTPEQQFAFAKEKFGKELRVSDVFSASQFVDVKAVDKGKGFSGVVKRAGVKVHRPKSKKHRYVGSIGPWHPPVVMWTVARAGQLGYQTRTEYNRRILVIENNPQAINPAAGFGKYGLVKNDYILLAGSVPGPAKRIVALRHAIRPHDLNIAKYTDIKLPGNFEKVEAK